MYVELKKDVVEIIKKLFEKKQAELIDRRVFKDHVPMYVVILPKMSISEFLSYWERKSMKMISIGI